MDNIELSNYQGIKEKIKAELNRVTQSFVEIGYRLKQVRDGELYKLDGYSNINDFAKAEYNLSQSTTSRFIAINDRYSVNGSSPQLLEQYEGYGYSKLSEMLTLSEEDMDLVTVHTTRAEIRDIKQAKAEAESDIYAPAHNQQTIENTQSEQHFDSKKNYIIPEADKLIIEMYRNKKNRDDLKELAAVLRSGTISEIKAFEIINPSGYRVVRKGANILMFGEKEIKYDNFRGGKADYSYIDFIHDVCIVFDLSQQDPWVAFYGEPEPDPVPEKKEPEKKTESQQSKKELKPDTNPIKPEQKPKTTQSVPPKTEVKPEEQVPGQQEIKDYPELLPDTENQPEEISDEEEDIQRCRVCGCTDDNACPGGCYWVEDDLCSACAEKIDKSEEKVEVLEADIVEKASVRQQDNERIYTSEIFDINLFKETGELQIVIKDTGSQNIKVIKAIDAKTGNIWEVTAN